MNWSRGLFRAWVLGSTLWLLGWSAHLLLGWPRLPAETADCEAVKRFVLTQSYIETFVDNPALEIKPDRTLMVRYEPKSICQYVYRTDALSYFFYDTHRENVLNHIVTTTAVAFGIPAISFVLGWAALLWVGRGFKRD